MQRTQIQLPDDLYQRAKRFAAEREMTLAEAVRRALEMYLDRYPSAQAKPTEWTWPVINVGLKVPLENLHDIAADEESMRSLPHPEDEA